ncbi:MAG TPA: hypothetical protein VF138_11250 [Caulobacteraceae bacterium]
MSDPRALGHPAPHRQQVSGWKQGVGVYAAPAAWGLQFLIGYSLAAYACHPGRMALADVPEGWEWTRLFALVVNIVAAGVALWAGLVALSVWRATRREKDERSTRVLEAGEGRTRFLGVWGMLTSFGFLIAIIFDTVMILGAPACRG